MWLADPNNNIAMSCLPKNGATSMRNCFIEKKIYKNNEVLDISVRVAWIRNPMERLISAYSFFYYLNEQNGNKEKVAQKEHTESWESFVDHFLSTPDIHWNSQKEILSLDGEYIPTISHRFEDIMKLWGNYLPGLLPWWNACTKLPTNDYRKGEIDNYYAQDLDLWLSLKADNVENYFLIMGQIQAKKVV